MRKYEWHDYPYCSFYGAWAKVYTLADDKGNVFYVGVTTHTMKQRLANHLSEAKSAYAKSKGNARPKCLHIVNLNYKVKATIIDRMWVTASRSQDLIMQGCKDLEEEWIKKYADLGYELLNGSSIKKRIPPPSEKIGSVFISTNPSDISEIKNQQVA